MKVYKLKQDRNKGRINKMIKFECYDCRKVYEMDEAIIKSGICFGIGIICRNCQLIREREE